MECRLWNLTKNLAKNSVNLRFLGVTFLGVTEVAGQVHFVIDDLESIRILKPTAE